MMHLYQQISELINFVGFAIIVIGAVRSVVFYLRHEAVRLMGKEDQFAADTIRGDFGAYLLLGLEFSVAADVIATLIEPTNEKLIQLGALIAIRTVIAYFIGRERVELREQGAA